MRVAPRNDTDNPKKGASGVFGGARKDGQSSFALREIDKLYMKIYRIAYFVGIQFLRTMKRYRRNLRFYAKNNRVVHFFKSRNTKQRLLAYFVDLIEDVFTPFVNIAKKFRNSVSRIAEKGKKSVWAGVGEFFGCMRRGLKQVVHSLVTISHYVAPVLGVLFLIATVQYFTSLTYGLEVEYGGKTLGYIESETQFEQAEKMMQGRIKNDVSAEPIYTIPTFKVTVLDKGEFSKVEEICNGIIKASGSKIIEAAGLYIDGEFYGATYDQSAISNTLKRLLDAQRSADAAAETVNFVQDVRLIPGLYPQNSIVDTAVLESKLTTEVEGQQVYTVEEGDSPWSIARKVNVKLSDLLLLNPGIDKSLLIGQNIIISKAQPFLPIKSTRTVVYEDELPYEVVQNQSKKYNRGYTQITQKGENGLQEVTAKITLVDGVQTDKVILSTRVLKDAVPEQVTVGTKEIVISGGKSSGSSVTGSGQFMWPVVGGGSVSCGFMGYRGHTGMDITLYYGAQIVAADDGVVVVAKRTAGGYGNHVMIDHGNGVQTLYGHMSKRFVSVGDTVKKGEPIGLLGATGNVTGPHLHFEIRVNGRYMNPSKYF
ncbi:Murein DD-endopeptidase MepM and murein hydrolase activator NlpD, contain LysM domain [Acetanaerobacterium elongatum]|uniref:Murein DD-endopeptidase MepM and murein hydrolase activator NlpD, contain LysM domain n=1 Tax=Acetanaerobacterium elongatum TaxID=258515 RepID=A0A1H0BTU8_9FIRM|nr:Murein DD-endopeptidase MepM and murein hydrolase activator NlpD, contain LysM domain [Acetanaerobacterium elongatum]